MVKQCAYGTFRSDTEIRGMRRFFSAFPKPKTQEERCQLWIKQCGGPNSIYRKIHICLLQNKLSCVQLASWRTALLLGMMTNYLVERTSPNSYGSWQLVLLPSEVHN